MLKQINSESITFSRGERNPHRLGGPFVSLRLSPQGDMYGITPSVDGWGDLDAGLYVCTLGVASSSM